MKIKYLAMIVLAALARRAGCHRPDGHQCARNQCAFNERAVGIHQCGPIRRINPGGHKCH